jgi:hypothetical protein
MSIIEIAREDWRAELDAFTTRHEGWLASLAVLGPALGAQHEIDDLPLLGVSADRPDHAGTVSVSVARTPTDHLTRVIRDVTHLYVERAHNGAATALLAEAADGTSTILRLRAVALPAVVTPA